MNSGSGSSERGSYFVFEVAGVGHTEREPVGVVCPRCSCRSVMCHVKRRDGELSAVEYNCRRCHYGWSDFRVLPFDGKVGKVYWEKFKGCEACLKKRDKLVANG